MSFTPTVLPKVPTLFPLQYKRQQAAPVDIDQVFDTSFDREEYLSSPRRYPGMIVSDNQTQMSYQLSSDTFSWIPLGGTPFLRSQEIGWGNLDNILDSTPKLKYVVQSDFGVAPSETIVFNKGASDQPQSGAWRIGHSDDGSFCLPADTFIIDQFYDQNVNLNYISNGWVNALTIKDGINAFGQTVPRVSIPTLSVESLSLNSLSLNEVFQAPQQSRIESDTISSTESRLSGSINGYANMAFKQTSDVVGSSFRITTYGTATITAGSTATFKLRMGENGDLTDPVVLSIPCTTATATDQGFMIQFDITCRQFGIGGANGLYSVSGSLFNNGQNVGINTAPIAVKTDLAIVPASNAYVNAWLVIASDGSAVITSSVTQRLM